MLLSICIPSIPSRFNRIDALYKELEGQIGDRKDIEIISIIDNKRMSIGKKRTMLFKNASGRYVTMIDDDDFITPDFVEEIYNAILVSNNVDVICYNQKCFLDDGNESIVVSSLNHSKNPVYGCVSEYTYRPPFHWCTWKRSLAIKYAFGDANYAEDIFFLKQIWEEAKTEYIINKVLCYYNWGERKSEAPHIDVNLASMKPAIDSDSKNYELLIKFPTRNRPQKFFNTLIKYIEYLDSPENTRFIISIDDDDPTMNNSEVKNVFEQIKQYFPRIKICVGSSKSKVEAINANMDGEVFDILLLASDDMIPQIKGYDTIIRNKMCEFYPDTDGILWFNDGWQADKLNTLVCCGYKYYKRFNYIYAPCYKSLVSDKEFQAVGTFLKKQTYFSEVIIKHMHQFWGCCEADILNVRDIENCEDDAHHFNERSTKGWEYYCGSRND